MRRTQLLFLCSALAPGSAYLVGCFGSNSGGEGTDAGASFDSAQPSFDVTQPDSGSAETGPAPEGGAVDAAPSGIIPTSVDFHVVGCGAPAVSQTFSVANTGAVPVTYAASLSNGTVFAISGSSSGTVAPGVVASLTLTATVPASATAGSPLTGQLTVTTNVPGFTTVQVPLSVTPGGGALSVSPVTAGFGQAQIGTAAPPITLSITNTGNEAIGVSLGTPSDTEFTVTYSNAPSVVTLQPGASLPAAVAGFMPTSAGDKSTTSAITTSGTMCASSVNAVPLSGSGTTAAVTVGPSPLNYGTITCGQTGKSQAVTITNNYTFAVTYSATLGKGLSSPYSIDAPTGSVPANGQVTINIAPDPILPPASVALNAFGDTLTVTTNAPGVPPATVSLQQSATGAILALSMPTTAFGPVPVFSSATLPFSVVNTGTIDAPLTVSTTGSAWSDQIVGSKATANGGSVPGTLTFKPIDTSAQSTTLSVMTTAPLCAAIAPLSVTGQGQSPDATFPGGPFTVETTCGGGSAGTQTITITNSGTTPLQLSSVGSAAGHVQVVSFPSGAIQPGASDFIVFQAKDAVIGTDAAGSYGDGVSFTTNEVGNPTHTVPVTVVIHGANLSFSGNPISFTSPNTCNGNQGYSVNNTGDLDALVTAQPPYPSFGGSGASISFDGTFSASGGGATVFAGTSSSDSVFIVEEFSCTDQANVTFSSPTTANNPVCIPLPVLTVTVAIPNFCFSGGSDCFCPCSD
jgi:hypothetical protein